MLATTSSQNARSERIRVSEFLVPDIGVSPGSRAQVLLRSSAGGSLVCGFPRGCWDLGAGQPPITRRSWGATRIAMNTTPRRDIGMLIRSPVALALASSSFSIAERRAPERARRLL